MTALYALAAFLALWCLAPSVAVLALPGVPIKHRLRASVSFLRASGRGLLMIVPDLLAPIVVPIALLGCRWDSERLPRWAKWWDNDVGLNGDRFPDGSPGFVPLEDTPAVRALCYWLPGRHPRSFLARYVWIGLRNRASKLALDLGHPTDPAAPVQTWGDVETSRAHEGWFLREHNGQYQMHYVRRLGSRLCLRSNYGHKVFFVELGRPVMPVVCITFSVLSWKGLRGQE